MFSYWPKCKIAKLTPYKNLLLRYFYTQWLPFYGTYNFKEAAEVTQVVKFRAVDLNGLGSNLSSNKSFFNVQLPLKFIQIGGILIMNSGFTI